MYRSMKAAIIALSAIAAAACSAREPDFKLPTTSPDRSVTAEIQGYQPRGTIEGYLLISFGGDARKASFHTIDNAVIGWTGKRSLAVVGDNITFNAISSDYFPDGTYQSRIRLIVCDRHEMDCSALERRIAPDTLKRLVHFPEG